jgi:hypothetical protein
MRVSRKAYPATIGWQLMANGWELFLDRDEGFRSVNRSASESRRMHWHVIQGLSAGCAGEKA